jgi:hypothetical protein
VEPDDDEDHDGEPWAPADGDDPPEATDPDAPLRLPSPSLPPHEGAGAGETTRGTRPMGPSIGSVMSDGYTNIATGKCSSSSAGFFFFSLAPLDDDEDEEEEDDNDEDDDEEGDEPEDDAAAPPGAAAPASAPRFEPTPGCAMRYSTSRCLASRDVPLLGPMRANGGAPGGACAGDVASAAHCCASSVRY